MVAPKTYTVRTGRQLASTSIVGSTNYYNIMEILTGSQQVDDRWLSGLRNFSELETSNGTNRLTLGTYAQRAGIIKAVGGTGADTILANAYTTGITVNGNGGADDLQTGSGNDTFLFSSAANVVAAANIDGNGGINTLRMTAASGALDLRAVALSDVQKLLLDLGSTGKVILDTTMSEATIGSSADATLETNTNGQSIDATALGDGKIVVLTETGTSSATVSLTLGDLDAPLYNGALTVTATTGTNSIVTGLGTDSISAGAGNDTILSGAGADTIDGGANDDSIVGGAGADSLTGGTGSDTFVYDNKAAGYVGSNADTITDFAVASDVLKFIDSLTDLPLNGTATLSYLENTQVNLKAATFADTVNVFVLTSTATQTAADLSAIIVDINAGANAVVGTTGSIWVTGVSGGTETNVWWAGDYTNAANIKLLGTTNIDFADIATFGVGNFAVA